MNSNNIYSAPAAELEQEANPKAGTGLKAIAILLSLPICLLNFSIQFSKLGIAGGIGGAFGSIIPALVVVALLQIFKRFRNSKSRWKIFAWSQVVFLVGTINSLYLSTLGQ
ncbi:hypothetical protein [Microbulbifer sp. SAOS-129_SWC]|uniref:hypothetical protein n=1 Tax=Microbulbifer sp. SAOS-129_SWC TaxID=3145235 RepID=UPI00321666F4